jgi:hypothetical protein
VAYFTEIRTFAHPEEVFKVVKTFYSILIQQTPSANMEHLMQKLRRELSNSDINSAVNSDRNLLHNVSKALISEGASTLNAAFSINPTAKERIIHPLFGTIIEMESGRYGWESGVPLDNTDKLNLVLKEKGISANKRVLSHSIKDIGRKNIFENLDGALDDSLMERLNKAIQNRMAKEHVTTTWVFSPTSNQAETDKSIREWLFRRDNNGTGRTH